MKPLLQSSRGIRQPEKYLLKHMAGARKGKSSSSVDRSRLCQLLIDVKILRKRIRSSDGLDGERLQEFSDAVSRLYDWLDQNDIETIETIER